MSQSIAIRLATEDDLPYLQAIEAAASRIFPPDLGLESADTLPTPMLEKGLADGLLWVATTTAHPVAFALAEQFDDELHLHEIDVHPDFGRRGIGRLLIEQVVEVGRQRPCSAITLTTFDHLAWNRPYYERLGFQVIPHSRLSSRLQEILEKEANFGLPHRVAMIKNIDIR